MSWQDIMIQEFGCEWLKDSYTVVDMGKLAERLDDLEQRLKEAEEVIGFYDCWRSNSTRAAFKFSDEADSYIGEVPDMDDFEILQEGSDSCNVFMGKRARDYQQKYSGGRER